MARPGRKPKPPGKGAASGDGESVSGYFRRIFEERPDLLAGRSNDELLLRWLKDHPGEKRVPERVKYIVSNVKSVLRKKGRKRGRKKAAEQPAEATTAVATRTPGKGLEALEVHIDDSLTLAKNIDREGLESVINHLRRARNEVVWKMGK